MVHLVVGPMCVVSYSEVRVVTQREREGTGVCSITCWVLACASSPVKKESLIYLTTHLEHIDFHIMLLDVKHMVIVIYLFRGTPLSPHRLSAHIVNCIHIPSLPGVT